MMMSNKMELFKRKTKHVSTVTVAPLYGGAPPKIDIVTKHCSFHKAIAPVLTLAQIFGLMPVTGVRAPNIDRLQFKWLSWKTVYSVLASFSIFCIGALYFAQFSREELDFGNLVSVIFYTCQAIGYMLFIRVAAQWFSLNKEWLEMEMSMKKYDTPPNDAKRFKITTVVLMLLAIVEHTLSDYKNFQFARSCPGYQKNPLKAFFSVCCTEVFTVTSYAHWKAVLIEIPIILSTFHWTFIDLFIIIVSAALAERFRQLNRVVLKSPVGVKDALFWKEIREDYTRLWTLTRTLDKSVCHLITLSFGSNLFFICWQMFNSLKPMKGAAETVYFFLSFGYLLARTATVSVYCCWINDEGKEMLLSLFNLPSEYYGTEASRLIQQICAMPPALTGSNYFAVTRGLCLQVAGAVITFEIILVQIGPAFLKTDDQHPLFCMSSPD